MIISIREEYLKPYYCVEIISIRYGYLISYNCAKKPLLKNINTKNVYINECNSLSYRRKITPSGLTFNYLIAITIFSIFH